MIKKLKTKLIYRRAISAAIILLLLAPSILSVVKPASVSAISQMTHRNIRISTSVLGATSVTYKVTFTVNSLTDIKGIVVQICQDSPLLSTACTTTNGVASTPTSGTIQVTRTGSATTNVNFTVDNTNSTSSGLLILTDSTGITTLVANDVITLSFTATNPTGTLTTNGVPGTFYGRLATYGSTAAASAYTATSIGSPLDQGGVAMSTANQLTTNARVQEQLQFCIGGTTVDDSTTPVPTANPACSAGFAGAASCGTGTTIDLGVIDNTAINVSPVSTTNGGNGCNGAALIQTNASYGVAVTYYGEPNGTNHTGALRVNGATCAVGVSSTDQCFNSVTTQAVISKNTEEFGVTVAGINCQNTNSYGCDYLGSNYSMIRNSEYDGTGADAYPAEADRVTNATTTNGFAWDDSGTAGSPQTLADSGTGSIKVVDNEVLILKFAASAAITTPTGQYSVLSTYVATPSY